MWQNVAECSRIADFRGVFGVWMWWIWAMWMRLYMWLLKSLRILLGNIIFAGRK